MPGKNIPHREAFPGYFEIKKKKAQFLIQHQNILHFGFAFPILILNLPHSQQGGGRRETWTDRRHFIVIDVALAIQKN